MELDVASYRRVAETWAMKDEDINPSAAAVLMLQMCSELERLQKADYEFQAKLSDGITDAFLDRRWIAVSERLPEKNEPVCVICGGKVTVGTYSPMMDDWWALVLPVTGIQPTDSVTHWMPLPEPPEAK